MDARVLGERDPAVDGEPRHELREDEVLPPAPDLPDALVLILEARDRDVDDLREEALAPLVEQRRAGREALPHEPRRRDDLAEGVDLELVPRAVAHAYG